LGSNKQFTGFANAFLMKTVAGFRKRKPLITTQKMTTSVTGCKMRTKSVRKDVIVRKCNDRDW
jgi:hypothetical protein